MFRVPVTSFGSWRLNHQGLVPCQPPSRLWMERPCRKTLGLPRRNSGKPSGDSGAGGALRTSAEDIVRRWKEYLEDLLNHTGRSTIEEAESGHEENIIIYRGITLLSHFWNIYARVLESSASQTCDTEGIMGVLSQPQNTRPALYPLEDTWEYGQQVYTRFVVSWSVLCLLPRE